VEKLKSEIGKSESGKREWELGDGGEADKRRKAEETESRTKRLGWCAVDYNAIGAQRAARLAGGQVPSNEMSSA